MKARKYSFRGLHLQYGLSTARYRADGSLQDGMAAAPAVILGSLITLPVVEIEDQMLAFKTYDIGDTAEVLRVFGDHEGRRAIRNNHTGRIDITALVVLRARILGGTDGNVGRIVSVGILRAVRSCDEYCVIGVIQVLTIAILSGNCKEVSKTPVDRLHHRSRRLRNGIDVGALRSSCRDRNVSPVIPWAAATTPRDCAAMLTVEKATRKVMKIDNAVIPYFVLSIIPPQ